MASLATARPSAAAADARVADAMKRRDSKAVLALLEGRADVNAPQPDGATALHWAAYWGDLDATDRLIRAGARVDAANDLGVTPLFLASTNEDAAIAKRLLTAGANPNVAAMSGESPIMAAARAGRAEIVQALIARGANVNAQETGHDQSALMWAVANGRPEVVRVLLAAGADVRARSRVRERKVMILTGRQASYNPGAYEQHLKKGEIVEVEEGGYTPLLFAAQQGQVECAKLLLAAGADVNDRAPIGMSALVIAAYSDQLGVGRFLLDKGANPNDAAAGYTALHAAVLKGNLDFVKTLLEHRADPNLPITKANGARRQSADFAFGHTLVGASPLYLAAKFDEIAIMRALAAGGADLRFVMPDGSTPMMAAMDTPETDSGDVEGLGRDRRDRYVFFRLIHTQSPDEINPKTPEEEEDDVLTMVAFLAGGVDVNVANQDGDTAMHFAAARGLDRVIRFLVGKKADLNAENGRRQTPLDMAETPRRNRGGDPLGIRTTTAALLRSLGGQEGGEPVPDLSPRRAPRD
jgi:ankyrin repeat protein